MCFYIVYIYEKNADDEFYLGFAGEGLLVFKRFPNYK